MSKTDLYHNAIVPPNHLHHGSRLKTSDNNTKPFRAIPLDNLDRKKNHLFFWTRVRQTNKVKNRQLTKWYRALFHVFPTEGLLAWENGEPVEKDG